MSSHDSADLGALMDPDAYQGPIELEGISFEAALEWLRSMLLIREVERRLAAGREAGLIGGPVHLGVGQEAVAVGVSAALRPTDRVFSAHRSHAHILALGSSVRGLFAEVLGRDTGLARGMGGSMHLWDQPRGFWGSVPIVGGTVPIAVGAGLAARMQGVDAVAVAYFGDGAIEEGVVHESLNLARQFDIPVLFVCENNLFASHMHISQRQPRSSTARFGLANDIPVEVVDGNDVVAVHAAAEKLIARARSHEGPGFLEAVTYRWYGHVDWREDIDVGVNRSSEDLEGWRRRDPVRRFVDALVTAGHMTPEVIDELTIQVVKEVEGAWEKALRDPYPSAAALIDRVYAL